ncbi:MAG: RNA methyltransferase [Parcubacteria group bacterium]|nr:RNA methyltransferase [Parcubacteria group bacterium]
MKQNNEFDLVVLLHNIRSTYNVGAIFRTADAIGVSKIYLCGITPAPPHPKISKTALGAEKSVPYEKIGQTWRLMKKLKENNYQIIALEQTKKAHNIFQFKNIKARKIALILGPEVKGLSSRILKYCNLYLEIPMYGKKESLNVAVAFGIAVYILRHFWYNKEGF